MINLLFGNYFDTMFDDLPIRMGGMVMYGILPMDGHLLQESMVFEYVLNFGWCRKKNNVCHVEPLQ